MLFLKLSEEMPCDATMENLMKQVWGQEHWMKAIFDRVQSSVRKYNVEAMFLQLIAARLIGIEKRNSKLVWVVKKKETQSAFSSFNYDDESCWGGVYLETDAIRKYKLSEIKK